MGLAGDRETAGGGRIVLIAKSLLLHNYGAGLKANAMPFQGKDVHYTQEGGSGGYIYVKTAEAVDVR
jgi:hypothetical protein